MQSISADSSAPDGLLPPQLFLVATPIGNLKDITLRAIETLRAATDIACEDTRRARTLLAALGIPAPSRFIQCADPTEARAAEHICDAIRAGRAVVLITDAGMPVISDPGYRVVQAVLDAGLQVTVIPGPTAPAMAFAASAIGGSRYCFLGFLPKKIAAAQTLLMKYSQLPDALIFFEPARRVARLLSAVRDTLGDRPVCIGREMTKRFEEFIRGSLSDVADRIADRTLKGECTVVIGGRQRKSATGRRSGV